MTYIDITTTAHVEPSRSYGNTTRLGGVRLTGGIVGRMSNGRATSLSLSRANYAGVVGRGACAEVGRPPYLK